VYLSTIYFFSNIGTPSRGGIMTAMTSGPSPARPWPAEQVELWAIERLIPYGANPRLHTESDIEKIAASILKWGWTNPVLVDEQGGLIAGHGRVAAAARLELKSIPVIVARCWSEEEKQAYRLADNELAAGGVGTPSCCAVSCRISNSVVSTSI
jgi:hypothetical protein